MLEETSNAEYRKSDASALWAVGTLTRRRRTTACYLI